MQLPMEAREAHFAIKKSFRSRPGWLIFAPRSTRQAQNMWRYTLDARADAGTEVQSVPTQRRFDNATS
jgi:hypothetical protein